MTTSLAFLQKLFIGSHEPSFSHTYAKILARLIKYHGRAVLLRGHPNKITVQRAYAFAGLFFDNVRL
jgi:hypothetical protein